MSEGLIHGKKYGVMQSIGRLSIGIKVNKNGVEYPQAIDYFRATGNYANLFHEAYGEKPSQITIRFLTNDARTSCNNYLEIRKGPQVYARGDGVMFEVADEKGNFNEVAVNEDFYNSQFKIDAEKACSTEKNKGVWKSRLDLRFLIEGLQGIAGYWQLTTHGDASSINNLVSSFHFVKNATRGHVKGLLFNLNVKMHKSDTAFSKKKFPVLSLVCLHSTSDLMSIEYANSNNEKIPFFIETFLENKQAAIEYKENEFETAKNIIDNCDDIGFFEENMKTIADFKNLTDTEKSILRNLAKEKKAKLVEVKK
jgi:hypothetical protein